MLCIYWTPILYNRIYVLYKYTCIQYGSPQRINLHPTNPSFASTASSIYIYIRCSKRLMNPSAQIASSSLLSVRPNTLTRLRSIYVQWHWCFISSARSSWNITRDWFVIIICARRTCSYNVAVPRPYHAERTRLIDDANSRQCTIPGQVARARLHFSHHSRFYLADVQRWTADDSENLFGVQRRTIRENPGKIGPCNSPIVGS